MEHALPSKGIIRKLDRYLISEVLSPFFGSLLFLLFVFLMFQVLRLAELFIVHGISGGLIARMVLLLTLSFLPMALPISFLLASLVGFGRLSTDSELVAMKACGISIYRMVLPVLGVASVVSVFSLALNLEWVPWGENEFKSMVTRMANTQAVGAVKEGTFNREFFDLLIFADKVDPDTNEMENVFIYDERQRETPLTVVARKGNILPVQTGTDFGSAAVLRLTDGNIHKNEIETQTHEKTNFDTYSLFLEVQEGKDDSAKKPRRLALDKLLERIENLPKNKSRYRSYVTELWRRICVAISPLILAFVGVGFGTFRTRSARASAAFITLVVIILYWTVLGFATEWGNRGVLPPPVAMMTPNLVMVALGIFGFRKANW